MRRERTHHATIAIVVLTVIFGIAYPLLTTGVAQLVFPNRGRTARQTEVDGTHGSGRSSIGQAFPGRPAYFQPRPSATGYSGDVTFFNNLGPNSAALSHYFRNKAEAYVARERPLHPGLTTADVPVDAVTTSASGVDPQISEANARIQANRVAAVRKLPLDRVLELVDENTQGRALGVLGEPGVNVLELNIALDEAQGVTPMKIDRKPLALGSAGRQPDEAQPGPPGPQPGDVRGRDRRRDHHPRLDQPGLRRRAAGRRRRARVVHVHGRRSGSGSRSSSPTSPRRSRRVGARRRRTRCARCGRDRGQLRDGGRVPAAELRPGDVVVVEAGETIPGDGTVIEGIASVDESAITGESAPVIRESGGDRSAVTGGTRVLSDRIVVEITQEPGKSFLDRMIGLVEGAERRKTPNEVALNILLAGLTLVFLVVVVALRPFADFAATDVSVATLIALLVALIPTTIGALLSAIGIAGMDRLVRRNVLALSGRAVEASGDVDVLLLDKTGTITLGNREATEFVPMPGVSEAELAEVAQIASLADETPEGRSIVVLAKQYGIREHEFASDRATFVPFTAETRMSGIDLDGHRLRKGAGDAIIGFVAEPGRTGRRPSSRGSPTGSPARAARRWPSPATSRCSASSTSRTWSRRGCASASTSCGRWASARSWSRATTG